MATQHNLPSTDRYRTMAPKQPQVLIGARSDDHFESCPSSLSRKQMKDHSPRNRSPTDHSGESQSSSFKMMMMKEMVIGMAGHQQSRNAQVSDGLSCLLSHLKIMARCIPQRPTVERLSAVSPQRLNEDGWMEENARLNATIQRLRGMCQSRQIREKLLAIEKVRDRISKDYSTQRVAKSTRKSGLIRQIPQSQMETNDAELKDLKVELTCLKKQKVRMLAELNREMEISNKKSEEIKVLHNLLNKRQHKSNMSPSKIERCRSNSKEGQGHLHQLTQREDKALLLVKENQNLKNQLKENKSVDFSQSFLSDAFNFRDQQLSQNKEQYEGVISDLRSQLFVLQNQVDSNKLSEYDNDKIRLSVQQTAECKCTLKHEKQRSYQTPNKILLYRITDLEGFLKRQQSQRRSLQKEVASLRNSQKTLSHQVSLLRGQLTCRKSPDCRPSELMRSTSNGQLANTGFRHRR